MNDEDLPFRIHRIDDADGRDPLVDDYLAKHQADCAWTGLSLPWLIGTFVGSLVIGALAMRLFGSDPNLGLAGTSSPGFAPGTEGFAAWMAHWFGDPSVVYPGIFVGGTLVFVLGLIWRPRDVARAQEAFYATPLAALALVLVDNPLIALSIVTGLLCVTYLLTLAFRILALLVGRGRTNDHCALDEPEGGWPIYTVLVPLYRERAVASSILTQLKRIDYPHDKLDVKLLLEADDDDTLAALADAAVPDFIEIVIVPDAQPKTKPRACNHGLREAAGEFLVIFDAEDRPEPDQLKKAVATFQAARPGTVCVQARLNYHNVHQNLLTRWFASEYAVWFGRYLPGLLRLGAPIPLGGTSNHFRTDVLRQLDGWDPFNVTEDCDLGLRLAAAGHRTGLVDSTTWEEANSRTGNWIRQRSRWLKGYLLTHVVWWRHPPSLIARLGPWRTFCFLASVGGVAVLAVVNIALWIALATYGVTVIRDLSVGFSLGEIIMDRDITRQRWSWPLVYTGPGEDPLWSVLSVVFAIISGVLLFANLVFMWIGWWFGVDRWKGSMIVAGLLTPIYWVLMSIAAVKGTIQAILKPHYWEKTVHGLDAGDAGGPQESSEEEGVSTATPSQSSPPPV